MESVVIQEVVEYLLAHYFRSKKELASEICISYRTLLNCYTGKGKSRANSWTEEMRAQASLVARRRYAQ